MLLTASAGAADTEHGDAVGRGIGDVQIDGHRCLLFVARRSPRVSVKHVPARSVRTGRFISRSRWASEPRESHQRHGWNEPPVPVVNRLTATTKFDARLADNQEARRDRKARPWPSPAHRQCRAAVRSVPADQHRRRIRQMPGELARAAGENHVRRALGCDRGCGEPNVAISIFLHPPLTMPTSAARDECAAPSSLSGGTVTMSLVGTRQHTAIERLDSLGVDDPRVQPAGDVHGDVMAAKARTLPMNRRQNGAIVVVPAPRSTTAAPIGPSSSARTARPAT